MANLWNPLYLPYGSLTNWYDSTDTTTLTLSTGNKVADWRDKSYDANNLSEVDYADLPVYGTTNINGLSTVDFDSDTSINLDRASGTPLGTTDYYIMYAGFNNTYTVPGTMYSFNNTSDGNYVTLKAVTSTVTQLIMNDGPTNLVTVQVSNISNAVTIYTVDVVGDDVTCTLNYASSTATGTRTAPTSPLNSLTLGTQANDAAGLNGQIGELIVAQQDVITLADKQKLEGYTAWKWGQVANLPGGHPYKTAAPTVTDVEFRNKLYETSTEEGSSRFRRLFALGYVG